MSSDTLTCQKCGGESFAKDRCVECGKHKDRPVFRVGTKAQNRATKNL